MPHPGSLSQISAKKKLFIKTYGCQMNVYDSERMADILAPLGYKTVSEPEGADMVILNTCHIREKASEKVFSALGRLRPFKEKKEAQGESMILAVAGCVAQAEGAEIRRRVPYVDMVFGPQTYHRLPEMIAKAHRSTGKAILDTDFPVESKFDFLPEEKIQKGSSAFLAIQEGCDKFCTFCVVPYTRGAEFSRPVADIVTETKRLLDKGVKEINFLGQNVNAYHGSAPNGQEWGLGQLLTHLATFKGLERIRFTTSHPKDMKEDLYEAFRDVPQLMPYFHLPVQSGSDRILEAMNRGHSADEYRSSIEKLRSIRPDIAISGDFIVGFPGETAQDFAETLRLVTDINYSQAYSFKYSPRPGTPAASSDLQVPEEEKMERLALLQELLNAQQTAFNQNHIGKTMSVLLESKGKQDQQLIGRSPYLQSVHVHANERLLGQIVDVKIQTTLPRSLGGEVVTTTTTTYSE